MEELAEPLLWDEVVVCVGGGVEELSHCSPDTSARSKGDTFLRRYRKIIVMYKNIQVFELY